MNDKINLAEDTHAYLSLINGLSWTFIQYACKNPDVTPLEGAITGTSHTDKIKITTDIAYGSFATLQIKNKVRDIALWDTY